jgi:hypothetical protein
MAKDSTVSQLFRAFKDLQGTDSQVESGIKCYQKPNRTTERKFKAQDAARIMCYAFKGGASEADMVRRFRFTCKGEAKGQQEGLESAVAAAMEGIELNTLQLFNEWRYFLIINGILLAIIAFLSFAQNLGPLRLVAAPLRVAARVSQVNLGQLITFNITRRAANDVLFEQLKTALRLAA